MNTALYAAEQMKTFVGKAIRARETFFQAIAEAQADYKKNPGKYLSEGDAEYQASQSLVAKQAIGDNNWHMKQAIMFGIVTIAYGVNDLLKTQRRTNALLTEILEKR